MGWERTLTVFVLTFGMVFGAVAAEAKAGAGEKGPNRLKFRGGPSCNCSTGLNESDIKDAERKRKDVVADEDAEEKRHEGGS